MTLLVMSCNRQKQVEQETVSFQPSEIKTESCSGDSILQYTVFLPSGYSQKEKFPVIYAFDSQARGALAVNLFSKAAEEFKYIVIGSNNMKNNHENAGHIIKLLFDDSKQKFSIDENRIYLAGFSGGARVAASIALNNNNIKGIITCGAGMPVNSSQSAYNFDLVSIIGNEDFNYLEVKSLEFFLKGNMRYHTIEFNGKHEWPSSEILANAVLWHQLRAMQDKLITQDEELIADVKEEFERKIAKAENTENIYNQYQLYNEMVSFLSVVTDIDAERKKTGKLARNEQVTRLINESTQLYKKERNLMTEYQKAFPVKDISWWNNEINSFNNKISTGNNNSKKLVYRRLFNYLGMLSFAFTQNAIHSGQKDNIAKYLSIYDKVSPDNPDVKYFTACYNILQGDTAKMLSSLKEAVKIGFTDVERLLNDEIFSTVKDNPEFTGIINSIKK